MSHSYTSNCVHAIYSRSEHPLSCLQFGVASRFYTSIGLTRATANGPAVQNLSVGRLCGALPANLTRCGAVCEYRIVEARRGRPPNVIPAREGLGHQ